MTKLNDKDTVRLDKFLWSVRIFKTRSISAEACNDGRIKLNDTVVKASRTVKAGDVYEIRKEGKITVIKVKQVLFNRLSAELVKDYIEDLTPEESKTKQESSAFYFKSGKKGNKQGRPTKRDRRTFDRFLDQ